MEIKKIFKFAFVERKMLYSMISGVYMAGRLGGGIMH